MAAVSTRPSRAAASPFGSNRDSRRDDGPSNTKLGSSSTRSTSNELQTSDKAKKADAEDSSTEGNDESGHTRASSDPTTHDNKKSSSSLLSRPPARPGRNGGRSPMNRSSKDDEPNPFEQSFSKPPSSSSTAAHVPSSLANRFDAHTPRRARSTSPGGSTSAGILAHSTSAIRTPAGGTKLPSLASLEAASPAGDLANFWDAGQDSLRVGSLSPAMLPGPISNGGGDASSRWLFNPMQSGLTPLINGMAGTSGGVGSGVGGIPGAGGGGMTPGTAALFQMMTNATPGTSSIKTGGVAKSSEGNAFEDSFGRAATTAAEATTSIKTESTTAGQAPLFMTIQQAPKPLTSIQRTSISGPVGNAVGGTNANGNHSSRGSSLSTQGGLGPRQSVSGPIPVPFGAPQPYPAYGTSSNGNGPSQSSASPVSRHANSVSPPYGEVHQHGHYAAQGRDNNPLYLLTQAQHHLQHNHDHNDESVMAAAALSKLVGGGGGGGVGQQSAGYPAQQEFGHQQQMVLQQQQQAAQQYHAAAAAAAQAQEEQRQGGPAGRGGKRGSMTGSQTSKDGGGGSANGAASAGTKRKKSAASQGTASSSASAKKKAKKGKDDDVASSAPARGKAAQQQQMMDDDDDDDDGMDDDDEDDGSGNKKDRKPETDEEKRKNFLERNRQAALKCRQRKKQWLANLQQRVEYLTTDNDALQNQVSSLREEISSLRAVLVAHKDCSINAHGHGHGASTGQTVGGVLAGQTFAPPSLGGAGKGSGAPQMHAPMGAMRGHNHGEDSGRGAAPSGALRY